MPDTFLHCNHCSALVYVKSEYCYHCGAHLPLKYIPSPRRWYHNNALLLFSFTFRMPFAVVLLFARYDTRLGKIAAVIISALMLCLFIHSALTTLSSSNN